MIRTPAVLRTEGKDVGGNQKEKKGTGVGVERKNGCISSLSFNDGMRNVKLLTVHTIHG